jgi:polysaccharide export outer membrane protein
MVCNISNNYGQENFMDKNPSNRFTWLPFIIFPFVLAIGCSGPAVNQIPSGMAMSQLPKQENGSEFQNPIPEQMRQGGLTYKDYAVGPEDLLSINFYGQNENELGREVRVNGNGEITMPLVGAVKVSGLPPVEIESRLMELYKEKRIIKNPQIAVFVKEYRNQKVSVTGAVKKPGSYEVIGPRTLLEMLGKAGGMDEKAGNTVQIVRHQSYSDITKTKKQRAESSQPSTSSPETIFVDLQQMIKKGQMNLNVPIKSGDIIYVPFADNAYILGAVNKPGNVLIKNNLTVTQAVALAGGINHVLASGQVLLIRLDDKGQRVKIPVNLATSIGEEGDITLKENDIVFVQEAGFKKFLYNFRVLSPIPVGASVPFF